MSEVNISSLQTVIPAVLTVITGVIGFFRINNKTGRIRTQMKETLELAKMAGDSGSAKAKEEIDALVLEQITRLRQAELNNANRQYSGATLGGALIAAVPFASAAWLFFTLSWSPALYLAWTMVVIISLILLIGVVGFFGGTRAKSSVDEGAC